MTAHRTRAALGPALAVLLALAGCAAPPDLDADRAGALQAAVLTVSQDAAAGQYAAAQESLADVRRDLERAADAGEVSTARYRTIDDALDRTADELTAAIDARAAAEHAAAQAAAQQVAAEQAAAQHAAEQAAAEQAAAEQAAAERAAAEQAAGTDEGSNEDAPKPKNGPKGKGKGADED